MAKLFTGVTTVKDKTALVSYNSGWGDIGEWYVVFSDGRHVTIENAEQVSSSQHDYLNFLVSDEYRAKVIESNWEKTGNNDDVIRRVLEDVGYDEDSRMEDEERIQRIQDEISAIVLDFATYTKSIDFNVSGAKKMLMTLNKALDDSATEIEAINNRMRVFDALEEGKTVGMNWSNETFFRDYGHTDLGLRMKNFLPGTDA